MTDRKSIEARLVELKGQLEHVEGTPTEVYSRIVGYYRSVRNWNAGKREEYGQRRVFDMPTSLPVGKASLAAPELKAAPQPKAAIAPKAEPLFEAAAAQALEPELRDGVIVFTREACPNCPPVKNYVVASGMKALFIDVDEEAGLALARERGVMATPTVLGLDGEGRESFRAFDLAGLRSNLAQGQGARV
jgi:ribonucleoside-triphosphate reductase